MASIEIVPSGVTGASNMTVSSSYPASNAYHDSTNTSTYARYTLSASTTGYVYFTFDTSDIPSTATIQSVSAKARLRISSTSRVTSRVCQLYNGTTAKGSSVDFTSTSSGGSVVTLTPGTWTRSELDNLRMRIGGTGSSSSQNKYIYIYGADITITYVTTSRTVTTTLTGNGTISPSGATTAYDGDDFVLTITPTNMADTVTATKDGVDVTSEIVAHYPSTSASAVLGTYTLVSGGFNGSGATYFQGIVGNGHDTSETTTSNYYSSGSGTNAVFQYATPITIPSGATVTRLYMMANGHAESTSNSSEYMCVQLKSGSTELSEQYNFKDAGSTSNSTQTIEATTLPTVAQLSNLVVECTLGYYGGAINGVTVFCEYSTGSATVEYYTYTYTVNGDATIAVTIGGSVASNTIYFKSNGAWVAATAVYKKVGGVWVLQSDLTSVFDANTNYVKG